MADAKLYLRAEDDKNSVQNALLEFEQLQINQNHKIGVLYCKSNQTTESEMLANETSSHFEEFLNFIGDKIVLKDFPSRKYDGLLDTKYSEDGTHSFYTEWNEVKIMYHVSTLLPLNKDKDSKFLRRIKHIFNDSTIIIFKEDDTSFSPLSIESQQTTNIFVVKYEGKDREGNTRYRLAVTCKQDVPSFKPTVFSPAIFLKNTEFREFLLTKLINAERVLLYTAYYEKKIIDFRRTALVKLVQQFERY